MKLTVVRYRTKPETAEENARLIQAVFQELRTKSRDDVRYLALRLSDGTFIHFSIAETAETIITAIARTILSPASSTRRHSLTSTDRWTDCSS